GALLHLQAHSPSPKGEESRPFLGSPVPRARAPRGSPDRARTESSSRWQSDAPPGAQRRARIARGSCLGAVVLGGRDDEPAPEGALEHVALLLGGPPRHAHVFLGFELQLDVTVADPDVRRAD